MSATMLDQEMMQRLQDIAAPLLEAAWGEAETLFPIHEGATSEEIAAARYVATYQLVLQATLNAMPLTDIMRMVALGSVAGTALGQIETGRQHAYAIFNNQMAATMTEVARNLTPPTDVRQ